MNLVIPALCLSFSQTPHEALCNGKDTLCPIDVWQPQQTLRINQDRGIIPADLPDGVEVEVVETEPPEFNE